jgi:hypothetical protein
LGPIDLEGTQLMVRQAARWGMWVLALASATPAWAGNLRNPAHDAVPGQYWLGIHFEDYERTFDVEGSDEKDYGVTVLGLTGGVGLFSGGLLNLSLGSVTFAGESLPNELTGAETGLLFRWNLDNTVPLDPSGESFSQFRRGLLAGLRFGRVEDSEGNGLSYRQTELGLGVGTPLVRQVQLYGGGLYSGFDGTSYQDSGPDHTVKGRDSVGLFAGIEYRAREDFIVGAEIHLVHEWGLGMYVDYVP